MASKAENDLSSAFTGTGEAQSAAKAQAKSSKDVAKIQAKTSEKLAKMQAKLQKELEQAQFEHQEQLYQMKWTTELPFHEGELTGSYQGGPTLQKQQLTEQGRQFDLGYQIDQGKLQLSQLEEQHQNAIAQGNLDLAQKTQEQKNALEQKIQDWTEQSQRMEMSGYMDNGQLTEAARQNRAQDAISQGNLTGVYVNPETGEHMTTEQAKEFADTHGLDVTKVMGVDESGRMTDAAQEWRTNAALNYAETAAKLQANPGDYFESAAFMRGAQESGVPAFLQQINEGGMGANMGFRSAQTGLPSVGSMQQVAGGVGAPGAAPGTSGTPTTPQQSTYVPPNINGQIMRPGDIQYMYDNIAQQYGPGAVGRQKWLAQTSGRANDPTLTPDQRAHYTSMVNWYQQTADKLDPNTGIYRDPDYATYMAQTGSVGLGPLPAAKPAPTAAGLPPDQTMPEAGAGVIAPATTTTPTALQPAFGSPTTSPLAQPEQQFPSPGPDMTQMTSGLPDQTPAVSASPLEPSEIAGTGSGTATGTVAPTSTNTPISTGGFGAAPTGSEGRYGTDLTTGAQVPVAIQGAFAAPPAPTLAAATPPAPTAGASAPSPSLATAQAASNGAQVGYTTPMNTPLPPAPINAQMPPALAPAMNMAMPPTPTMAQMTGAAGGLQANPRPYGMGARATAQALPQVQVAQQMPNVQGQVPMTLPAGVALNANGQPVNTQQAPAFWNPMMGARANPNIPVQNTAGMDTAQRRLAAFAPTFLRGAHKLAPGAMESMSPTEKALFGSAARASGIRPEDWDASYKRSRLQTDMSSMRV